MFFCLEDFSANWHGDELQAIVSVKDSIAKAMQVLVFLAPWNVPDVKVDFRCLLEVAWATEMNCGISAIILPSEIQSFRLNVCDDVKFDDAVFSIPAIDASGIAAADGADSDSFRAAAGPSMSDEDIANLVSKSLRSWLETSRTDRLSQQHQVEPEDDITSDARALMDQVYPSLSAPSSVLF